MATKVKDDIKLPPLHYDELPEPDDPIPAMHNYARKAIKADRQRRGEPSDDAIYVLKLALEYWADRQQRYRNRVPVWVQEARALLAHKNGEEE